MRKLSTITAPIINRTGPRAFARRQVTSFQNSLTCLVLFKHAESGTQYQVSDDGDAIGAVWIDKSPVLVDPRFPGPFLVVTLTRTMAQQHRFIGCILDWSKYTPEEQCQLKDAVGAAFRARKRLGGVQQSSMGYHGRNAFA